MYWGAGGRRSAVLDRAPWLRTGATKLGDGGWTEGPAVEAASWELGAETGCLFGVQLPRPTGLLPRLMAFVDGLRLAPV